MIQVFMAHFYHGSAQEVLDDTVVVKISALRRKAWQMDSTVLVTLPNILLELSMLKSLLIVGSLFIAQSTVAGPIRTGAVEVKSVLEYATMEAEVACVVRVHPRENEEADGAELFFVNGSDYARYADLAKKGFRKLATLKGGRSCGTNTRSMPTVYVGLYDKSSEVRKEVLKQKASSVETVIFINSERPANDLRAASQALVNRLTR